MSTLVVPAKWSSFHAAKEFTHGCQNKKRVRQRKAAETVRQGMVHAATLHVYKCKTCGLHYIGHDTTWKGD